MEEKEVDVTLLITFHREGILAHSTLNSIERCRRYAEEAGISTEYVWVLDSIDEHTRAAIATHPVAKANVRIIEVAHRDAGASRNSGIAIARGRAVAVLDGDDYFSTNWIERAWFYLNEFGPKTILHPEFVINFGSHAAYCWQIDQNGPYFDKTALLLSNFWSSWTFAMRSLHIACPYVTTRPNETGYGYEDWHWNCETIGHGYEHRLAWGTIGFYRRKLVSLVTSTTAVGAIIPPTKYFSKNFVSGVK